MRFFINHFKDLGSLYMGNQMKVIEHYLDFFTRERGLQVGKSITTEEVKSVLTKFAKDKKSRAKWLDYGTFYYFFDVMGKGLLAVAEIFRSHGYMFGDLNSTFISLNAKIDKA